MSQRLLRSASMLDELWLTRVTLAETAAACIPMNALGAVGSDAVQVDRIRRLRSEHGSRFERLVFTNREIDYCMRHRDPDIHFAGRFAAKEAVYKAIGEAWTSGFSWRQIEIRAGKNGAPEVRGRINSDDRVERVRVTISHTPQLAVAVAWLPGASQGGERVQTKEAAPSDGQQETLLEALLRHSRVVWRYRGLVIPLTIVGALLGVGLGLAGLFLPPERNPLPNRYEANAMLIQQRGGLQDVTSSVMASLGIESAAPATDYGQIAISVLNSRTVIDPVIRENGFATHYEIAASELSGARKAFVAHSSFAYDARTGILRIAYEDTDPEFAAAVVSSVVAELLEWFSTRGGLELSVAVQTLESKLLEVENRVNQLEDEIEEFQREYGVLRVEELADTQSSLLAGFQAQLLQLDLQISNLRAISRFGNDPELVALQDQRRNVMDLMERVRQGYTDQAGTLPPRSELPALAAAYSRLQTDLEIQRRIYVVLAEQHEVARLTAGATPAFTILEAPEVPLEKSGPSRSRIAVAATAAAFLLAVGLALVLHGIRSARGTRCSERS